MQNIAPLSPKFKFSAPKAPQLLPDKPSDLIRVAVGDVRKILKINEQATKKGRRKPYTINMNSWHVQINDKCHVCLGGSVISQSLGASKYFEYDPDDVSKTLFDRFDGEIAVNTRRKLVALNLFRSGLIESALLELRSVSSFDRARRIASKVARAVLGNQNAKSPNLVRVFSDVRNVYLENPDQSRAQNAADLKKLLRLLMRVSKALKAEKL